ncbi:Cytochrome b5-like Heme/Steroid binding domain [Geosmithia morbida]|uniref:Cytochrome b5-like Heme/Steroid binding domain n=1 Tax=Geosmithia morbida TaxID=1094350 RepID=A0A9P4YXZ8_9HYPO|nr:Cytochrome b5-like Heme/Steroid binding domain [Geosmithia morbida]KAF4124935.1 Cytochrome b5-like Heme/Steroid binding domain [Geosmithia morbida]
MGWLPDSLARLRAGLVGESQSSPSSTPTPPPPPVLLEPTEQDEEDEDEQATPRASATPSNVPVPSLSLSADSGKSSDDDDDDTSTTAASPPSSMMPPPPPPPPRLPTLSPNPRPPPQFLGPNSAQRARGGGPVPNRNPMSGGPGGGLGGGLAPPVTQSLAAAAETKKKSSKKVILAPGRSPLDWARISGSPTSDLRGLPPSTPYLRVTPSMLKRQTGRKGKDAWTALNGKVYNITPYAEYHPAGVGELMRGAGRDGTKLFADIHPWVNYESMLASCLVGILVDESEGNRESEMDKMD